MNETSKKIAPENGMPNPRVNPSDKKSFILYADSIHVVRKLSKDQIADLYLAILSYANGETPVIIDVMVDLVFDPIKRQMDRDLIAWSESRSRKSEGGKKGMEKRWGNKSDKRVITKDNIVKDTVTPITVTVTDTVNVNATVNVNDKKGVKVPLPQSDEFKGQFNEELKGWPLEKITYYWQALQNYSNQGNKYIDWISTARQWAARDEKEGKIKFDNGNGANRTSNPKPFPDEQKPKFFYI